MEILTQLHFSAGFASYFHVVLVWAFLHRAESASWEERREVVWFWALDPPPPHFSLDLESGQKPAMQRVR